jgi:hypothetical protein
LEKRAELREGGGSDASGGVLQPDSNLNGAAAGVVKADPAVEIERFEL